MGAALSAGALAAQPVRVTVDLSFGKMMQPREHKSLAHQLVRAYGLNRKAKNPLALHFSASSSPKMGTSTICARPLARLIWIGGRENR